MTDIKKQLEAAREKLLDLTMRNRLLNYRPSRARTVRVVDEIPQQVYEILVLRERAMEFRPKPEEEEEASVLWKLPAPDDDVAHRHEDEGPASEKREGANEIQQQDNSGLSAEESSILWSLPAPEEEVADRHVDRFLQTSLEASILQKRLFHVNQQARSVLEEQGYTVLYLALGFLKWTESSDSMEFRSAPLILVPVDLERKKVGKSFRLRWTGEDICSNISLQKKLLDQGVSLPEFDMPEDMSGVEEYLQNVNDAVSPLQKWQVVSDIYLDFFSFTKFVMYKDLDPKGWPEGQSPADHPLIRAILAPSDEASPDDGFSEDKVDDKLSASDVYHVMDADSSQIAAIEDAKAGRNLVVEGPPGTGKSQSITNLIAELLAAEKSVLFVSEKMAALEVVKGRLDRVGLGDFCLELHSRKSKKKEVLKELERIISSPPTRPVTSRGEFDILDRLKSELNRYAASLGKPFGSLGYSPFTLICIKEKAYRHFERAGNEMPHVHFSSPSKCDRGQWTVALSALTNLSDVLPLVQPVASHAWQGCEPGPILPADEEEIKELLKECSEALHNLDNSIGSLAESTGVTLPTAPQDVEKAVVGSDFIAKSKPVERGVLLNPEWDNASDKAESLVRKVEEVRAQIRAVHSKFQSPSLEQDIDSLLSQYKTVSMKMLRFFNARYRQLKREISALYIPALYKGRCPRRGKLVISDLEQLTACQKLREEVRQAEGIGRSFFGCHWQAEKSDPQTLRDFAEWVVPFRRQLLNETLTEDAVEIVSAGVSREQIGKGIQDVLRAAEKFFRRRDALFDRINANVEAIFGITSDKVTFSGLRSRLHWWKEELSSLQRWSQFVARRNACRETVAEPIVALVERDALRPDDVIFCFKGNFADAVLRDAFAERPPLSNFVGRLHEGKIRRFMDSDFSLIKRNRGRLAERLWQQQPRISRGPSPTSEAGILLVPYPKN